MTKRLFWLSVGFVAGVVTVTKARAYVKANTPQSVRGTLFPDSEQSVAVATLAGLWKDFTTARESRERELNSKYQDVV